jgi:hypothetical protein
MKKITSLLALMILVGCGAYIDETRPAKFIPRFSESSTPPGYEFEGNTITYKILDSVVKIKYMESSDIDLFFLKYDLANPFIASDFLKENMTLFLLTFVNNEKGKIRFDPRRASIYIRGKYYRGSSDYTEVMMELEKINPGTDPSSFKKAMYDLELDINPKSSIEGLLVFPFIPKRSKRITVLISGIFIADREFTIPFEFQEK